MLSEILSAFEFADRQSLDILYENMKDDPRIRDPFQDEHTFYLLVETSGSNAEHDVSKMHAFLEECLESGDVIDGTLASDEKQASSLWALRENITTALVQTGHVYKYDLSVPINHFHEIVEMTREKVNMVHKDALICGYGHVGDSNVHLNVCTPGEFDESAAVLSTIEPFVYDVTRDWGGALAQNMALAK